MIVSAHQPNFMPWLGFFDKMARSDLFVLVDHVQFERQNFQNRTRIKSGAESRWISVPVVRGSRSDLILEKRVDNSRDGRLRWGRKMFLALKAAYRTAPYYKDYEESLVEIFDAHWDHLLPLNEKMIEFCRSALGITTPMLRSSRLRLNGAKSDMVLALCREVGADAYLAGTGASKNYLDLAAFERAGIRVLWQDFVHPRYPQIPRGEAFVEKLSAFDYLFNCGPRAEAPRFQEAARGERIYA